MPEYKEKDTVFYRGKQAFKFDLEQHQRLAQTERYC